MTAAPPGGSGEMFDAIAEKYDLVNRVISLGVDQRWRKKTVRAMGLGEGAKVLDLATGTGDLAILIAKMNPTATVIGLDPSAKMLAVGEGKIRAEGLLARVTMKPGDAQAIDEPDASVDATSIALSL